jgi:hypothetical protein
VTFVAAANTLSAGIRRGANNYSADQLDRLPCRPGLIQIGSEQIRYATVTGNDLEGVTRGVNGTHPCRASIWQRPSTAQR